MTINKLYKFIIGCIVATSCLILPNISNAQVSKRISVVEQTRPAGIGKNLQGTYPWSGSLVIWVDDGFRWTIVGYPGEKSLVEIFEEVNRDSGLVNTEWEMHFVTGINVWGANALGTVTVNQTDKMTRSEVLDLYKTGLCEIALHGANDQISDPYTSAAGEVSNPWAATGINAAFADSGSTEWIVKAGYNFMVDSLGIPKEDVRSYMTNGHRIDDIHRYYISKYFANCRSGTIFGSGTFPTANGTTNSTNVQRGSNLEFSRTNFDPYCYMFSGYDNLTQEMYSLSFPIDRLFVAHLNAVDLSDCKKIATYLAEIPATGILTWHDQNKSTPTTNPDLDGIAGVEAFIRYCAHYCNNGRLNRDAPRLQLLTMDEAMSKHTRIGSLNGGYVSVPNITLAADSNSTTRPWGTPVPLVTVNSDSGWVYIPPSTANAAGGWFGYFNGTGVWTSNVNSDADAGADTNFKPLTKIYPVSPGSRVRFGCYASANRLLETGAEADSLSACYIDIEVSFGSFDYDYSDSTSSWLPASFSAVDPTGPINAPFIDPYGVIKTSDMSGSSTNSSVGYGQARVERRFHKRDAWSYLRSQHWNSTFYNNSDYSDGAGNDHVMRWREFNLDCIVPQDMYWCRVRYIPTGWTAATSDSLAILPIGPFVSPQG